LQRDKDGWKVAAALPPPHKGPHRYGSFKDAFRHRVMFVYGTKGSAEENAWSYAKARYDAETFWYRGNGSVDVIADTAFDAKAEPDRSVIVYGNADTNAAWRALLGDSPVQVGRGVLRVGDRERRETDLACLFIRPRPGSDVASVGVVSGTGLAGMRLSDRSAYFVSGAGYPDCLVFGPKVLTDGSQAVLLAGFFGPDWGVSTGELVWNE
jgi:hypothetical protein